MGKKTICVIVDSENFRPAKIGKITVLRTYARLWRLVVRVFSDDYGYPISFSEKYSGFRAGQNSRRLYLLAFVATVFSAGVHLYLFFSLNLGEVPSLIGFTKNINYILPAFYICSIIFIARYRHVGRTNQSPGLKGSFNHPALPVANSVYGGILYVLSGLLSINAQSFHGSMVNITSALVIGAVIFLTGWKTGLFIHFFMAPIMALGIWWAQPVAEVARIKVSGMLIINLAAWIVSRYLFHYNAAKFKTYLELRARRREQRTGLRIAAKLQEQFIPAGDRQVGRFRITTYWQPMGKVGGNLVDFIRFDEPTKTGLFVCDVLGRGVPAAFVCTSIKSILPIATRVKHRPEQFLNEVNQRFVDQISGNYFVSLYGVLDDADLSFTYCRAGAPYPMVFSQDKITELTAAGNLMGGPRKPDVKEGRVILEPGDRLLVYTFGLYGEHNRRGEFYRDYMRTVATRAVMDGHPVTAEFFYNHLLTFKEPDQIGDDITIVSIEVAK